MEQNMRITVLPTTKDVCQRLAQKLDDVASAALCDRNQSFVSVGISGGSLLDLLSEALPLVQSDLTKWRFYMCDERFVADTDADSNFNAFKSKVFPKVPALSESQILKVDTSLELEACAANYARRLLSEFDLNSIDDSGVPYFDVLLLGMGPDGHTCSLFPSHKALEVNNKIIAAIDDSPKPPAKRITMTFPLLNNAHCLILAIIGEEKADVIKRAFVDCDISLPIALVCRDNMELILDEAAAKYMPE